ncbi:UDP-N-acetylmuramoyl-L-alanyl-D-glutamate--2,6-diaminopimelate ligase [Glycocaulis sp.]|uniref:UDP-N-acetylmuramoyl-L-alanyl-D-glutamate--2, 6-diaminopimelate ligase n=1 Tax=Glycocaulis sp. TaxID=1969725 RepID=UPI003D1CC656
MSAGRKLADILPDGVTVPDSARGLAITGLALDSRAVKPGFVFAALPGVTTHGNAFIKAAVEAGAVAVLAERGTSAPVPVIEADDPRLALAHMAARFSPAQPKYIAAITGTNGKSSTVEFLRQIWQAAGHEAAALGTLGVTRSSGRTDVGYTTPDAIALHAALDALSHEGVTHLAMEASSHGLKQRRMDGAKIALAGFSNLTQDHLDYHPDFEDYFASKMRLFDELLPEGAPAVITVDSEWGEAVVRRAEARHQQIVTVGWNGRDIQLKEITPHAAFQHVRFVHAGKEHVLTLPLMGEFQASNAFQAAGMAIASGVDADTVFSALENLKGVAGRLELVGETAEGAPVLIDYAHTPDGLDKLLRAARPHTAGRVIVVFGAGGDRDPTKREKMGAIAAKLADRVIVTDDNPRSEDPALIRKAILKGAADAEEIGDRETAIFTAIKALEAGDTLLLAGKGHETGQTIKGVVHPFDDGEVARRALAARAGKTGERGQ